MSNISRNGRPEPAFPLYTPEEYTAMHVAFCRAMLRADAEPSAPLQLVMQV